MAGLEIGDVVELIAAHGGYEKGTSGAVLERPRDGGVVFELFDRGGYSIDVASLPADKLRLVKRPDWRIS